MRVESQGSRFCRRDVVEAEASRFHLVHPIFHRLAVHVVMPWLVGEGMRHGDDICLSEYLQEVLAELLLDVLNKLATPHQRLALIEEDETGEQRRISEIVLDDVPWYSAVFDGRLAAFVPADVLQGSVSPAGFKEPLERVTFPASHI